MELLRSLPGTDTSLEEQEAAIAAAKVELKRISYVVDWKETTRNGLRCTWTLFFGHANDVV